MKNQLTIHLTATRQGQRRFLTFEWTMGRFGPTVAARTYPVRAGRLRLWKDVQRWGDWYAPAGSLKVAALANGEAQPEIEIVPEPTDRWGNVARNAPLQRITKNVYN